jgi:hypothetical protein
MMRANVPAAGGQILPDLTHAVCGMSAHARGRAITNNHATAARSGRLDGSSWNSGWVRKSAVLRQHEARFFSYYENA